MAGAGLLACLVPVSEHLSVSDLLRVWLALGRPAAWPDEATMGMARCMELRYRGHHVTMRGLADTLMRTRRCLECGRPTRHRPRVCVPCAADPCSRLALVSRAELRRLSPARRVRGFEARLRALPVAKVGRGGRYLYWRRAAERHLFL
jgi:hypothetical protein